MLETTVWCWSMDNELAIRKLEVQIKYLYRRIGHKFIEIKKTCRNQRWAGNEKRWMKADGWKKEQGN